ncbi:MAG: hypothetical protein ACTHN5_15295 [Phycisphaerae bacterium]
MTPLAAGPVMGGGSRFYRHSGRVPANALVAGIVVAIVAGLGLGAAWGPLELYLHLAPGKLMIAGMIFGLLGWGFALGWIPAAVMMRFKGRSPAATVLCTMLGVVASFYAAWAVFVFAFIQYNKLPISLGEAGDPRVIGRAMKMFFEQGVWSIFDKDTFPKGIVLAGFWIAEFFIVAAIALKTATRQLNKRTFCEHCETWGTSRPIMEISDANWRELQNALKAGEVNALNGVTARTYAMPSWCDVKIEGCPTCDNVQTLTVTRTVLTQNKKGKPTKKTTDVVRRLVMTPEQTVQVAVVAAGLKAEKATGF